MAEDSESSDNFCSRRNNWELVSLEKVDCMSEEASSSSIGSNEASFYDNELINKDYFAAPSMDAPYDTTRRQKGDENNASLGVESVGSPPSTSQCMDWMEPSMPVQSCVIGTSEDGDSFSRSCSGDSRGGSIEHLVREKDAAVSTGLDRDTHICDYAAMLHDVPVGAMQESNIVPSEEMNDASSGGQGGDVPWRCCLGVWLSEMRRTSSLCSIALAAAVIGLVLVGSGCQRIRAQYQRLRCRVLSKGKGGISSQVMHHLVHIKDSSSKHRRIALLKAQSCFADILNGLSE